MAGCYVLLIRYFSTLYPEALVWVNNPALSMPYKLKLRHC